MARWTANTQTRGMPNSRALIREKGCHGDRSLEERLCRARSFGNSSVIRSSGGDSSVEVGEAESDETAPYCTVHMPFLPSGAPAQARLRRARLGSFFPQTWQRTKRAQRPPLLQPLFDLVPGSARKPSAIEASGGVSTAFQESGNSQATLSFYPAVRHSPTTCSCCGILLSRRKVRGGGFDEQRPHSVLVQGLA